MPALEVETYFYHTWDLNSAKQDANDASGGLPRRSSIKVGKMMRSRGSQGNDRLRGITSGTFTDGASRLFKPSAMVRHDARLWEENG
jgi:hypothetical protein